MEDPVNARHHHASRSKEEGSQGQRASRVTHTGVSAPATMRQRSGKIGSYGLRGVRTARCVSEGEVAYEVVCLDVR